MSNQTIPNNQSAEAIPAKFYQRFKKEAIGSNNLLLSDRVQLVTFAVPLLVLIGIELTSSAFMLVTDDLTTTLAINPQNTYTFSRIILYVIYIYIFTVRFMDVRQSGKLGYWLALGMERERFLFYLTITASIFLSLSLLQIHLLQQLLLTTYLTIGQSLLIFLVSLANHFLLLNLTILIVDLVENAEVSLILMILMMLTITFFSGSNFLALLFVPELFNQYFNLVITFAVSLVSGIVLFMVNNRAFSTIDIELGG